MTTTPTIRRRTRRFTSRAAQGPIEFIIDGDVPFYAASAIPATEYGAFMQIVTGIGRAIEPITGEDAHPDPSEVQHAINQIVELSLNGMEMVLQPESLERIRVRISSKEDPIDVTTLSEVFQYLASVYGGNDPDADADETDPPVADDSDSAGSSAPTGTSSEEDTSTTEPTSEDGSSSPADAPAAAEPTPSDASTPDVTPT